MKSLNCVNKQFCKENGDLVKCDRLFEEDEDSCKVSSEIVFADNKDIDYHLVKNVKIERDVESSSSENNISTQKLHAPVFNINGICTSNDRACLATNRMHSKIKEEVDNYEEASIIESVISIESHPVSKLESLRDIDENSMSVLDESCSDALPHNGNEEIEIKNVIVHKSLKATEMVQREMETNLQLQNEVQTLNGTLQSDLQIKLETNSRDYDGTVGEEEYVNKLCVAGKNTQLKSKNHEICQNQRNDNLNRSFVCTICEKAFTKLGHLTIHKRLHTGEKPFGCTICGKAFTAQSYLTVHKRIHTGEKPFGCTICGIAFRRPNSLKDHKRIHTGEKPFGCTICGKAFTQRASLTKHKCIHTGEKPFDCTVCRKAFIRLDHLITHKRIHTGEKPFGCAICGKEFTTLSYLTIHKRIHTGEKPFGCIICGKAFTHLNSLKNHKHVHTGEKPFLCTICGNVFTTQSSLTKHELIHT